jgi:hypothetical protein
MRGIKRKLRLTDVMRLEGGKISVSGLTEELGWTTNQIWNVIKRDGIRVPKIWYGGIKISGESIERFKEMSLLRKEGWLVKQIAIKYKLSDSRVSEILGKEEYLKCKGLL